MRTRRALFALLATCALSVSLAGSGPGPEPNGARSPRVAGQVAAQRASAPDRARATDGGAHDRETRTASGVHDRPGARESASLSFAEPRDFATHADPSAEEFNRSSGDNVQNGRLPVSDSLAVGNFDEDAAGHLDVVQTNVLAGSLSVFRGDGRGGFSDATVIRAGVTPNVVLTRDLDRDGHLDLVVSDPGTNRAGASLVADAAVLTLRGDGHGGFAISDTIPLPLAPRNLALGDVNADGITDLAVASRGPTVLSASVPTGGVMILVGAIDESGGFTFGVAQTMMLTRDGQPIGANAVAVGDFDGSGGDDLAVALGTSIQAGDRPAGATEPEGDDLQVYLNRNTAGVDAFGSSPSQRFRVGATPEAVAAADWNGDDHVDLAVMSMQSGDVTTLTNDGAGAFAVKEVNVSVGALPRSLKVADLNRDGNADLVTATFLMSTVSVLLGHGDGTFEPAVDFWAGDAPTSVEVGLFDNDKRPDIVAARLRNDELALLINKSPRRHGVVATRDIPYVSVPDDPAAAHHTLDVWAPTAGTPSFTGRGTRYPVVVFAHGGAGITGDKTMVSYLMRSLARKGIIGVTIDYRLDPKDGIDAKADDYADAFRWLRTNVDGRRFGGDPSTIFVGGTSAGADAAVRFATAERYAAEHPHIRGLFVVGIAPTNAVEAASSSMPPPSLALSGDEGGEPTNARHSQNFVTVVQARGAYGKFVQVQGRDHFTLVSNLARPGDPGRTALLQFLRTVVR